MFAIWCYTIIACCLYFRILICYIIWTDWGGTDSYKWTEKDRSKKEGTRKETTRSSETDNSCWLPSRDKKIWKKTYKEEVTTSNKTTYWSQCKYIRTIQCFGVHYWESWRFFVSFIKDYHSTIIFQNIDLVLSAPITVIPHEEWKVEMGFKYTCFPSMLFVISHIHVCTRDKPVLAKLSFTAGLNHFSGLSLSIQYCKMLIWPSYNVRLVLEQ